MPGQWIDLLELHAREKAGMPAEWGVYLRKSMPPGAGPKTIYFECEGSIPGGVYRSGPRKGRPNWRRPAPGSKRTVYIPVAEHRAWEAEWSKRTGLCLECTGAGEVFRSWSEVAGTETRPCGACGGTGKVGGESAPQHSAGPARVGDPGAPGEEATNG